MSEISKNEVDDPIKKRINKTLESRLDTDKEAIEALTDLSTFFHENTLQTRRNLRSQIEKRSLAINENFLNALKQVKDAVDAIYSDISSMTSAVNEMQDCLNSAQSQSHDLIQQTNNLQAESDKLQLQQQIAGAFLSKFQLTIAEHQQLYGSSRDDPIKLEFFDALARVQKIHSECRVLMQSGYQTAALDIMEEMTLHQEGALERLYRWTQHHCRNIDLNEIGVLMEMAMQKLQDRPVLFKYVIDEYATSRRSILVRNFIDALTIGGPNGNLKPIELHAHDPKRYIGDMFAWIHQAIPTEKENLLLLLKQCDKHDLTDQIQTALSHISDGICHPLKVRVETILNSEKDLIVLYAVANLMRFYQNIVNNVVKGGQLEECLQNLQAFSEHSYLNLLSQQVKVLLQGPPGSTNIGLEPPKSDLVPPLSVNKLLSILKEILSVASMVESRQSDITKIVSCVIDPLLHSVTESASHLPSVDMACYMLNCLYNMQTTLAMYEYMDDRMERLQAQSDAQIDTLTSEQASSLVANLNLGPIYTILQSSTTKLDLNQLKMFMDKLDAFVEMPEILLLPQVTLLQSTNHRLTVQKRAQSVIVAIYKQLYERVHDPSNEYQNTGSVFKKTPEEVAELLSC
ncbi:hypothetical protein HA402_001495 [Bradysia odoriphaga]|nr:hypothetical protein HA402_001495 [Bradysia odoriphaga]